MLRRTLLAAVLSGAFLAEPAFARTEGSTPQEWADIERMAREIPDPRIPDRAFSPAAFGGKPDGSSDALPAIRAAIEAASKAGGGRIELSPGVWFVKGPVVLKSRIELHLAKGATLLFSPVAEHYLPPVKTRWEGTEVLTYSPLIYAPHVEDVAITGEGVIDGNAASEFHAWHKIAEPDFQRLRRMGFNGVPLAKRVFGRGTHLRPPLIQIFGGRRIKLEGFTAKNSPFWVNHIVYADQVRIRSLRVDSHFPNNDGVDVESSTRVVVEHSWFRTGDDSVVIKSGRDLDGRTIGKPSAYVLVRHNDMGGEDGIALGSEMSGGIHDVFFTDNVLRKGLSAIRFKANLDRGGTVQRIRVRNFKVEDFGTLFWFQLNYPGELGGNFPSTYRDIVFENIDADNVGAFFEGHAPAEAPLRGVLLKNISVKSARKTFVLENVEGLRLENVTLGGQALQPPR